MADNKANKASAKHIDSFERHMWIETNNRRRCIRPLKLLFMPYQAQEYISVFKCNLENNEGSERLVVRTRAPKIQKAMYRRRPRFKLNSGANDEEKIYFVNYHAFLLGKIGLNI